MSSAVRQAAELLGKAEKLPIKFSSEKAHLESQADMCRRQAIAIELEKLLSCDMVTTSVNNFHEMKAAPHSILDRSLIFAKGMLEKTLMSGAKNPINLKFVQFPDFSKR